MRAGERRRGFQIRRGIREKLPPGFHKAVLSDHDGRGLLVTEFPVNPVGGRMDTLRELPLGDLAKAVHEGAGVSREPRTAGSESSGQEKSGRKLTLPEKNDSVLFW